MLTEVPYQGYAYAYPHKTAYRSLEPPENLAKVWAGEDKSALFLYFHIPFCEMRCGFCNLFTLANPDGDLVERYLDQLDVQVSAVMEQLGRLTFARLAIGGGTPTLLTVPQLERLFSLVQRLTRQDVLQIPASVETSPLTATPERLVFLKESRVSRISIGVQSFVEAEVRAAGRSQRTHQVYTALDAIRRAEIPTLNVDLIYGLPGQTPASWQQSLEDSLRWQPEEIYLYPLYVRPLTGLDGRQPVGDDIRQELFRQGRDYLLAQSYTMRSMRLFQRQNAPQTMSPP
jgi:oxygen-independent coproporphyrinogen-3 oxidase